MFILITIIKYVSHGSEWCKVLGSDAEVLVAGMAEPSTAPCWIRSSSNCSGRDLLLTRVGL